MTQRHIVNRRELRVIGMSRSGNHAIIEWLIAQMEATEGHERICWLNCPEPKDNPFTTARPFDNGRVFRASYPLDLAAEQAGRFSRKDVLLFSYEDNFLANACSTLYEQRHDAWVGPSARRQDVLILRDPFNLFASRRRALRHGVSEPVGMRIWKQHARQFADAPRVLRHDPVLILYNRWCAESDYRRALCARLGLAFTDRGREQVAAVHGGSSFDGLRYHGNASRMRTAERWRAYVDDPGYRALFDRQTLGLARRIFGDLPAIEALGDGDPLEASSVSCAAGPA